MTNQQLRDELDAFGDHLPVVATDEREHVYEIAALATTEVDGVLHITLELGGAQ